MKKLILLAVTVLALFSCSNENDDLTQEKTRIVVVQFAPATLSRATGAPITDAAADKAEISDYTIFFLDAAGNVVKGTETGTASATTVACADVDKTAVSVYVVANTGRDANKKIDLSDIVVGSKLSDIKGKAAAVSTQSAIKSVVLANSGKADNGKITITPDSDGKKATAAVEIAPAICRLEISKIRLHGTGAKVFTLKGIYIDSHAEEFTIGGEYNKNATGTNVTGGIYSIGVKLDQLAGYPATFCDVTDITAVAGSSSDFEATPAAAGQVWTYQLAAGASMPKIIVELSIELDGKVETKYVTVNSYNVGANPYGTLVPGTVYKISDISFELGGTAEVPNAAEKEVEVTVTVKNWDVVNLTPVV